MSAIEESDIDVGELLPTGTVTLLLADVEGSTKLWERQPTAMTAAVAQLNRTVSAVVAEHGGVRPVEQGEGDSFVAAFAKASDAVACALDLQRANLAPIKLRIGVHTGEVQLRDEGNYAGQTINKTARLRDLAHGGQTVLSSATEEVIEDRLPKDVWLTDLGTHALRDVPRPVRVSQLCHPELDNDFPALRTANAAANDHLPAQLTSFVGRCAQLSGIQGSLIDNRLVTLTGAGGAGKTRLAIEVAGRMPAQFPDGIWYADLAPITHPEVVPLAVAGALGLPDQPGRSITDTLLGFVRDRTILLVLDNCEHLLEACAALISELLAACKNVTVLATSREPVMVAGEVNWQVPSLSLADEAIELFSDRARLSQPGFAVTDRNSEAVTEICRRLDGMPLAIELAAARVRALSLDEIVSGLHDRFRLLTGGARTAVRRQQTLRASVDWSHALLTQPERVLFRRLAVFMGGFDLDAAQAVAVGTDVERFQVLDQVSLLVDKSLVVAESAEGRTRYRLLETVRQYALEKLGESGEADDVRTRHRDHYMEMAVLLDAPARTDHERELAQAEDEIDNLRAAFTWSHENEQSAQALTLASALQPLWLGRGRIREGMSWLDTALTGTPFGEANLLALRARALADKTLLDSWFGSLDSSEVELVEGALDIARTGEDPSLLVRALLARGCVALYDYELARPYFSEAVTLARAIGDSWRLCQTLGRQTYSAFAAGDLIATESVAWEGMELADALGDQFGSGQTRWALAAVHMSRGEVTMTIDIASELVARATLGRDSLSKVTGMFLQAFAFALHGDAARALVSSHASVEAGRELVAMFERASQSAVVAACLADGDRAAAWEAALSAERSGINPAVDNLNMPWLTLAALAFGELAVASRWADTAVEASRGCWLSMALSVRARVRVATGEADAAAVDAYDALAIASETGAHVATADTLECLAGLASKLARKPEAGRLFGAAHALRKRLDLVRYQAFDVDHQESMEAVRDCMGVFEFEASWAEGATLSTEEAIAYALRGRGERKRPSSGWAALTPTELDVVRLVGEGLPNKDIATRLFVSPRTVQSHLRHVYNKLGHTSRVQLAHEAVRHD